ncbi:MAG: restriction endonuclease subunit S [Burkholderiales bacterium]
MTISDPLRAFAEKKPSDWQLLPFGAMLTEPVRNGIYKTKEFHGSGIRVVNMSELFGFDFISEQEMKRVELTSEEVRKSGLSDGDLLFARRSLVLEGAGKCSLVVNPQETLTFESSIIRARPNRGVAEPRFLFYLFTSPLGRAIVASIATRTAVSGIRGSDLMQVGLPLPPLPTQRRIASILSAYDDLIENNQRRIRILEEMARSLYREWFIHFRYPGHESVPLVDSSLGPIPQGWEVKKLGEIAGVNRAQINAKTAPDELRYIDIASVSPGQIDLVTTYAFADAPGRARRVVQHGDVIWSCVRPNRRSHALVMHPETNTIASTGFAVLTAKTVPFTFLYFATTTDDFVGYLTNNASGAAYPAVTATTFEKADLLIPPAPLLKKFGDVTIPLSQQIHTFQRKTANLRRTRDLLLPRLLSGQVALATAES